MRFADGSRAPRTVRRPEGSFTLHEYAAKLNIPTETGRSRLREAVRKGTLAQCLSYVPDTYGRTRPTYVYTVKHDA